MSLIHISLSPNLEKDDLQNVIHELTHPRLWKEKKYQAILKKKLKKWFPHSKIYLFNSGRSGLETILKSLKIPPQSEIIIQAFTCSAVINPLLKNKLRPVYQDIDLQTFNIKTHGLEKLITPKTKAIIIQHTFGVPAHIKEIKKICEKHNLLLIEDCAHALGSRYQKKLVGNFGDIAFFTFGRDKIISSVFGGAIAINNNKLLKNFKETYRQINYPPKTWTTQQLLHPLITQVSKKTYNLQIGKLLLLLSQKTKLISKSIYPSEHLHQTPKIFPAKLHEPLAHLALNQFEKIDHFNSHRQKIAYLYHQNIQNSLVKKPLWEKNSVYLRYNILTSQPKKLKQYLKKNHIIAGDWYNQPVTPSKNLKIAKYKKGSCPSAEIACQKSVNLPTHPTMSIKDAEKIIKLINSWSP